jgi:hypothetical protein
MIDRERARLAQEEVFQQFRNMPEYYSSQVIWYEGDRAVKLLLKYKTDYPFPNKVLEVLVVKQVIGEIDSYI